MHIMFIPEPRRVRWGGGYFRVPRRSMIGISDGCLFRVALSVRELFAGYGVTQAVPSGGEAVRLVLRPSSRKESYRIEIREGRGILLEAASETAAYWGLQTLRQIVTQGVGDRLPELEIEDWPDYEVRGIYYDVCRGRVPKLERLLEQADLLSRHKINHLQLYIEHTFRFRGHPEIGRRASPLTAEDILKLDAHCRERHVELTPSLASLGHLETVLRHPKYRHLAEDWGVGRYVSPEAEGSRWRRSHRGWSLAPGNPETYKFLDSLFSEYLPLFSSNQFNVCCDEVYDLGWGQSYALCRRRGRGRVYLDHIKRLRDLAGKYGKRIMFWGDIIRKYPDLIPDIPEDVTALDWGYDAFHPFDRVKAFRQAGVPFFACPGTSSWGCLFPRLHESKANIRGFADAGKRHGGLGLLTTDWGDGGHYNFMEYSWYGYLFGAEQAWKIGAESQTFSQRFARLFLGDGRRALPDAIDALGDITHLMAGRYYQSLWRWIFFAETGDPVFQADGHGAWVSEGGRRVKKDIAIDATLGRETVRRLEKLRAVFAGRQRSDGIDPHGVMPYWIFAVDTLICAAKRLEMFGAGGKADTSARRALRREMTRLMNRFEALWMARNRRSEIRTTLNRYRRAIRSI